MPLKVILLNMLFNCEVNIVVYLPLFIFVFLLLSVILYKYILHSFIMSSVTGHANGTLPI